MLPEKDEAQVLENNEGGIHPLILGNSRQMHWAHYSPFSQGWKDRGRETEPSVQGHGDKKQQAEMGVQGPTWSFLDFKPDTTARLVPNPCSGSPLLCRKVLSLLKGATRFTQVCGCFQKTRLAANCQKLPLGDATYKGLRMSLWFPNRLGRPKLELTC